MKGRRPLIGGALLLVALIALILVLKLRGGGESDVLEASGTVEAREADLGFQVAGRVAQVAVHEGDRVAAGQVLAVLDTAELASQRAGAAAQLAAVRAQLAELEHGARPEEEAQARAAATAARQQLENARRDLERTRVLQEGGALSQEALDNAETAAEVAQARYDQTAEQLRLVQAGPRRERIEAQRALVRQAEAAVDRLDATLANAVIRAPFAGIVTVRHREPGETLAPGMPVLTLMDPSDRWVRIFIPEADVGRIDLGMPAAIHADAYPDRRYDGRVTFISSEAEFTPRNVQTTEERIKLVYAVKVAITGDDDGDLKQGVPADVTLDGDRNGGV